MKGLMSIKELCNYNATQAAPVWPTHISELERIMRRPQGPSLIMLGGALGWGKTTLAYQLIDRIVYELLRFEEGELEAMLPNWPSDQPMTIVWCANSSYDAREVYSLFEARYYIAPGRYWAQSAFSKINTAKGDQKIIFRAPHRKGFPIELRVINPGHYAMHLNGVIAYFDDAGINHQKVSHSYGSPLPQGIRSLHDINKLRQSMRKELKGRVDPDNLFPIPSDGLVVLMDHANKKDSVFARWGGAEYRGFDQVLTINMAHWDRARVDPTVPMDTEYFTVVYDDTEVKMLLREGDVPLHLDLRDFKLLRVPLCYWPSFERDGLHAMRTIAGVAIG